MADAASSKMLFEGSAASACGLGRAVVKCPHCSAAVPDGARICRACGKILEGGGIAYGVADEGGGAAAQGPVSRSARPGDPAPRCEVCDKSPTMIQQVERNSPVVPAVMVFSAFLLAIMGMAWHSWLILVFLWLVAGGLGFVAWRLFTAEHRYWLCPKCGDTIDIEME